MHIYNIVIFISGGITLSLELLASRIMSPYFGVNLFIWAGILSITLVSLAIGYYWGGKLSTIHSNADPNRLNDLFFLMPAIAGLSLGLSCLIYPKIFYHLALFNTVIGAYIASIILLFLTLVTISTMNPILVGIYSASNDTYKRSGDKGSGFVFFISTFGSVAGVLVTAFVFIPNMTNFRSVLLLGVMLGLISLSHIILSVKLDKKRVLHICAYLASIIIYGALLLLITSQFLKAANYILYKNSIIILMFFSACLVMQSIESGYTIRKATLTISIFAIFFCGVLIIFTNSYLNRDEAIYFNNRVWNIEKEYTSLFGNIKIVNSDTLIRGVSTEKHIEPRSNKMKIYFDNGLMQNAIDSTGNSKALFTYVLETLSLGYKPQTKTALILGLGAGIIPMRLSQKGISVDVVEINSSSIKAATEAFNFNTDSVELYKADARTFVKRCPRLYDVIIVDLFHGDGIPEYLMTREFFKDLYACTRENGMVVFNTFMNPQFVDTYMHIPKTLTSAFKYVDMFHEEIKKNDQILNVYLVGLKKKSSTPDFVYDNIPEEMQVKLKSIVDKPKNIDKEMFDRAYVIEDEFNTIPFIHSKHYLSHRMVVLNSIPPDLLVN